jgi:hypothetical protein
MMARQIIKENKLQRGILGISSIGTPQIRKEDIVI